MSDDKKSSAVRAMYTTGESDDEASDKAERMWGLMSSYASNDVKAIQQSVINHVEYTLACTRFNFDNSKAYLATSHSVRDRLIERWNDTNQFFAEKDIKRVNYLSMEYLMGRTLQNALLNMKLESQYGDAMLELGYHLEDMYGEEKDAALGNGGLGRLAACFLDSLATLDLPAWGYGLRYTYGMFEQKIKEGRQLEAPDYWLTFGNPWEIERQDVQYTVRFYGESVEVETETGAKKWEWRGGEKVQAVAYDNPIPGYGTHNCINLRLWRAAPSRELDLAKFNEGDYVSAVQARHRAELISSVLYPSDSTYSGKELRLKQQYFFVSATLQDIVRRFKKVPGRAWRDFPKKNAIQLNDTHPSIGIPELLRILIDEEGLTYAEAWEITQATFSYTNHTLLPEALERWPVTMLESLLPRHLAIIYEINWHWMQEIAKTFPGDVGKMQRMSIIEEGHPKNVRMGVLSVVGSHTINGVAAIHSMLVKKNLFSDFAEMDASKFQNKTNGVTPRRWILLANKGLARIFTKTLGSDDWLTDLELTSGLLEHVDNAEFQSEWQRVKQENKYRLASYIETELGVQIPLDALYDVQVKRIHEYKRQLLNCLYCIHRYKALKRMTAEEREDAVARVTIFGGKAAPSYTQAKRIIHLIHRVGEVVNNDPDIGDKFKVLFLPNYNVSLAEDIIPAADLSQHISTAGMEASGTSNMKFAMNGSLIIGTMDGANIEIAEAIRDHDTSTPLEQSMFIFGADSDEVEQIRMSMRFGGDIPEAPAEFTAVVSAIERGEFGPREEVRYILEALKPANDYYLLAHDFMGYLDAQNRVDDMYRDQEKWTRASIRSAASMGRFSTDRTMREYASEIWGIEPARRVVEAQRGSLVRSRSNPKLAGGSASRQRASSKLASLAE